MVEHIVLLRLSVSSDDAAIRRLSTALLTLQDRIPGIVRIAFGANGSQEGLGRGYDLGFVVTFADGAARDAYLPHPEHQAVVLLVEAIADEVLVFDLSV